MTIEKAEKSIFGGSKPAVLTIVMDGVGLGKDNAGNAVKLANTPTLDMLMEKYEWRRLHAHGKAVGLPSDDDMGNSEVGHNALGAGQVFAQGAKLVSNAIQSGKMFEGETWKALVANAIKNNSSLHFIGLFSDGNVHSHIDHLKAMIVRAKADGVGKVRVHILLDGRDVGETSALDYVVPFEAFLASLNGDGFDACIASGGGRMKITMDRYEASWSMVEAGWKTHVLGEGRRFASAEEAIKTYRDETHAIDQDLPAFVIEKDGQPAGKIVDGDSVVFFNFRGDRAIEISKAFEQENFGFFARVKPDVIYAGMLEYDGDAHIPTRYLVAPPEISNTMGEYLADAGVKQLAISETQKYGHVTYFWNGNRSGKFSEELEDYIEIRSDTIPFEQRPWMQCALITDELIKRIESGEYGFLRVNFPNGDMVGHTGDLNATIVAMEALDLCLKRILEAVDKAHAVAIITADHGNADEMRETDKKTGAVTSKAKTSHTLNPVPCIFYDNFYSDKYTVREGDFGLANIASTVLDMLGWVHPSQWEESMIDVR